MKFKSTDDNVVNKDYSKATKVMRFFGIIILIIGLTLVVISVMNLFSNTGLFFLGFIGIPLIFVGSVLSMFGFMKKSSSFFASQTAPVQKDVTNYLLRGTRKEVSETAKEIIENTNLSKNNSLESGKTVKCPRCGEMNDTDAKFCDNCGCSLVKVCSKCGNQNDLDAKYCSKCGERLY